MEMKTADMIIKETLGETRYKLMGSGAKSEIISAMESYASQFKSNWIELKGLANEFDDCDCWIIDRRGNISISQVGEFIEIGKYTHYMKIEKPQPPTF